MRKLLLITVYVLAGIWTKAQTFNGTGGAVPGTSTVQTCFNLPVTGLGVINDVSFGLSGVCINMTHPNTDELEIVLKAPDGTTVPLTVQNGGSGNNYTNTCFSATSTNPIKFGNAPFTGTYEPEGYLGAVNNGQNANGTWTLCVQDRRTAGNAGTVNSWSLTFSNTPAPLPPTFPACANTLPANSSCANATAVCDFNGLCGNTSGSSVQNWTGSGLANCFGLQNNSFLKFIAAGTTASFTVWVPVNTGGPLGGIQMLFFSGTCDAGPVITHGCYPHIYPYQSATNPVASIITASGLTPGNTYYLMFDGFNNDIADFRIAAKSGVNFLNISPASPSVCYGKSVALTASGSDGSYSWSPATGLNTTAGASVTANPIVTTTYTVSSVTSTGCNLTKDVTVIVNDTPNVTTQPIAVQQVCQNAPTATLSFVANAGGSSTITGYQWFITTTNSNTGGTLLPFATNATYVPSSANVGTVYFYCRITNANGCATVTNTSQLTVYPTVATPVLQPAVQPTCAVPTGSVLVTSPAGANFEYSANGTTYQNNPTLSGLAPGATYSITARNTITGCVSAPRTVTINAVPTEPAPTAAVTTHPTCAVPTGTVTVSSPTGNYEYSAGAAYQMSNVLTGLAPGNHNISVRNNTTGCISATTTVTINAIPTEPVPTASITTQPTCSNPTGTITVSSPVGINYEYSIGGSYQTSNVFGNLPTNTSHNVTVRNNTTGCISNPLPVTIGPVTGLPGTPTVSVVQPDCNNPTGSISVTSPLGNNYEYSIGAGYQPGILFSSLTAGSTYQVTVRDILTGCVSAPAGTVMNSIPVLPPPAIAQPQITYCQNASATVLTATGTNLQWYSSVTGGLGSATAPTPVTSVPGVFKFYVSQKDGICESSRDSITVTVSPTPALPGTGGNTTTYCENETAAVLTATGSNLQWYETATGTTPLAGAPTPNTSVTGNTTFYVSQTINGCESARASITITINAAPPPPAVANAVVQYCLNSNAVPLTATGINLQWYDVSGNLIGTSAPTPSTATTGSTFYYVSQTVNGCESSRSLITVTIVAVPTPPVVTSPVEYCQNQTASMLTANGTNLQWYTTLTSTIALPAAPTPVTTIVGSVKYYVSQLINTCESKRDSITVITKAASAPPLVNSPLEFCQNTVAPPLTATGTGLSWYAGATGGPGSPTAPVPSTTNTGTTFFYVTQNTNGCESNPRTAITVTINPTSTAVAGFKYSKDTFCRNAVTAPSPVYSAGFTTGGIFTAAPAGLSINAATGDINLTASTIGTYTVTYTYNTTGCVNGNTASTVITLLPEVNTELRISYNSPVCKNSGPVMPQTLPGFTTGGIFSSAPAGLNLNNATGEINVAGSLPGVYRVFYDISELGCRQAASQSAAITLLDTTLPITQFDYSSKDICITGGATNPTTIKPAGFTTGGTFTVYPPGLNVNSTTGDVNIGLSVPGSYVIKYSVPSLLCRVAGSDSVVFRLRSYGNAVTDFSYVGPVCKGDDSAVAVLDVDITTGGIFSSSPGLVIDSINGTINLEQSNAGDFIVRYDVPQGVCNPAGFGTAPIKILAQPDVPSVTSGYVCGEGNVTLTAAALGTINWYTEPGLINQVSIGTTFSTYVTGSTQYYVTNKVGACESEAAIASAVVSAIPLKPYLGRDTSICANDRLVLNAGNYNNYLWQDGSANSTYTVTTTGLYKVIVSTGIGCSDSASINITVLDDCFDIVFPSGFAPNGVNRTFGALGNLFPISNYTLRIYNRYGQVIFASSDPAQRWDGTFKGQPVNMGTYTYIASYVYKNRMERVKKGTITVIR